MRDEYDFGESKPNPYAPERIGARRGRWDGFDYESLRATADALDGDWPEINEEDWAGEVTDEEYEAVLALLKAREGMNK